jgi:hypothetical protein
VTERDRFPTLGGQSQALIAPGIDFYDRLKTEVDMKLSKAIELGINITLVWSDG